MTEVQYQLSPQCHQDPIGQGAPGVSTVADATGHPEVTCEGGHRQEGCHHLSKFALGHNGVLSSRMLELHPPPLHDLLPTGLP